MGGGTGVGFQKLSDESADCSPRRKQDAAGTNLRLVSRYFSFGLVAPPRCLRHLGARVDVQCGLPVGVAVVVVGSAALGASEDH